MCSTWGESLVLKGSFILWSMETKRNLDKCRSIGAADQLSLDSLELGALGVHLSITPAAIHPASLCFLPAPISRGNCGILFLPSLLDLPSWGASVHHTHGVGGLVSAAGGTGGGGVVRQDERKRERKQHKSSSDKQSLQENPKLPPFFDIWKIQKKLTSSICCFDAGEGGTNPPSKAWLLADRGGVSCRYTGPSLRLMNGGFYLQTTR